MLHNLNCSWSIIILIFFHLIVSTIYSCRLKIAAVFLGFVLHYNHLCSSSSISFSLSFEFFLFEAFPSVLIFPSSSYFFDFSHAISHSLHHCSPISPAPTSKLTTWFTRSIGCYTICRCSHITCNSYFSLHVYVNKTSQLSTTIFVFCT